MKKIFGYGLLISGLLLGFTMAAFPTAVTEVAGLAVAQSNTKWNSVKDMAQGDAQTTGVGLSAPCLWNGSSCDRQRGTISNGAFVDVKALTGSVTPADGSATPSTAINTASYPELFNGSTSDLARSASATTNTAASSKGVLQVTPISTWSETATATAGTPSASHALGAGTIRHVATSITACVAAGATAQPAIQVNLRDGAAGAGTIIRSWALGAIINSGQCADLSGLNMSGTANTAMTLEFAAATAATVIGTVTVTGYSTP